MFAELFKLFLENNIRRVIVLDDSKSIVGIVSRRDIIKSYLEHTE
jgi:CBS domain-containing protein